MEDSRSNNNSSSLFLVGSLVFFVEGILNIINWVMPFPLIPTLILYSPIGILFLAFAMYYLQRHSLMSVGSWVVVLSSFLIIFGGSSNIIWTCLFSFGLILFITGFSRYENANVRSTATAAMILFGLLFILSLLIFILRCIGIRSVASISGICVLIRVIAFFVTAILMIAIRRFMAVKD